jgi:hypothetical protein
LEENIGLVEKMQQNVIANTQQMEKMQEVVTTFRQNAALAKQHAKEAEQWAADAMQQMQQNTIASTEQVENMQETVTAFQQDAVQAEKRAKEAEEQAANIVDQARIAIAQAKKQTRHDKGTEMPSAPSMSNRDEDMELEWPGSDQELPDDVNSNIRELEQDRLGAPNTRKRMQDKDGEDEYESIRYDSQDREVRDRACYVRIRLTRGRCRHQISCKGFLPQCSSLGHEEALVHRSKRNTNTLQLVPHLKSR